MNTTTNNPWIAAAVESIASYRRMIDAMVGQLSDSELCARPAPDMNSVAVILRHLGGNLQSRWTDFLTTDGEKADRDRDAEFQDWNGDRASLIAYFDKGWEALNAAIEQLNDSNINRTITIRGEAHTIPQALTRSITHLTYHVGQIALISRLVHQGDWKWLTIAPSESENHNERTWGTTASRCILGTDDDAPTA